MGRGRPSSYTPELADEICDRLASGESLNVICFDDLMPSESTVRFWAIEDREGFFAKYARAREAQAHGLAEQIVAIADDSSHDTVTRTREDGSEYEAIDHDHINRSRLRVDARKWYASKLAPKHYGDKITQEHTGKDGGPVQVNFTTVYERAND